MDLGQLLNNENFFQNAIRSMEISQKYKHNTRHIHLGAL